MISVSSAESIVLAQAKLLAPESCLLKESYGRILAEDIKSDRDQPSFNKSLMDGIAISYSSWREGCREFEIQGVVAAGKLPDVLRHRKSCLRIMTGAVLPKGCDCIVPVEWVHLNEETAFLKEGVQLKSGQFIRYKGADAKKNDTLLKKGVTLLPSHIGILASLGKNTVKVYKRLRVAVVATGDELVDINKPIKEYQTRLSNSYALHSLLVRSQLAVVDMFHVSDNKKVLKTKLASILKSYDLCVLSGGVSMGDFDFVPQVLKELKVKCFFSSVVQKPGKPFWFGTTSTKKAVFALPGNPVSTLICAYRYLIPYLYKCAGLSFKKQQIAVKQLPEIKSDLTQFLLVKDGHVISSGGSGDFAALAKADGFIEYETYKQQALWPYFSWRI